MKKIIKLMLAVMLMLTAVPTSSWQVFATVGEDATTIENKPDENTGDFSSEPTATPEVTVMPTVEPNPQITGSPDVTTDPNEVVKKASLTTIHNYIDENNQPIEKVVEISDLTIGSKIVTREYALNLENLELVSVDAEEVTLIEGENVVRYQYAKKEASDPYAETPIDIPSTLGFLSKNRAARMAVDPDAGEVFVTKEARWIDEDKGYAAIDFTLKGNPVVKGSDIVLVVDTSGSMYTGTVDSPGERMTAIKEATKTFSENIFTEGSDNRILVVGFSNDAYLINDNFAGYDDKITVNDVGSSENITYTSKEYFEGKMWDKVVFSGSTNYTRPINKVIEKINQRTDKSRPVYVLFMSDGEPDIPDSIDYNGLESIGELRNLSTVYSIGLEINSSNFERSIVPLASDPRTDYSKNVANKNDLASIYSNIANEIKIAGTEAVITDIINDDAFEIVNKPGSSVSYEATHGTVSINGNQVTWNIGDITESVKKLTIYIKLNNTSLTGTVLTNKSADIDYIDYNNAPQNKDIPNAALTIGDKGSIKMNYYLVDANGKLISQSGAELTDFSKRVVLKTEMYEKDGNSVLDFGTYLLNPPSSFELNGTKYVLVNDAEYSTPISSSLTINNINKDQNAYYGYKEYNVPPFIFNTKHYLENADGTFEVQFPFTEYEIPTNLDEILYAKDYVNDAYLTNYTFVENHPSSKPKMNNGDIQNNYMTLYYTRIMDNTEYTVNHVVNGTTTSDKVEGTIWRGETDKTIVVTSESLQPKTNGNYAGYKIEMIKDGAGNNIIPGSKVPNNSIITINYVKDETQTKEVSYKVKHTLPNGSPVEVVVNKTVWVNDADELEVTADSIATKAPVGYKLDTIKDTAGKTITAGDVVADKTEIEVTYVKDDTQTKSINYKVEHKINGIVRDTDNEIITVWVNDTQGTPNTIKVKTYTGYKVDQASLDAVPTVVIEGTVITINYVKDETQTKEVSYKVKHTLPNGSPVEVVVNKTVWINDADELEVTADSIATKAPVGYKLDTIKDTAGKTITAGDVVADKTEIEVTYVKDDTQTKSINYKVEHKINGIVRDTDNEIITVWVNDTQGTPNTIKVKTYTGYKVDQASLDAVPTVVIEGTVITINYVKDETQTKEIKYTVEHWLEGNSVATTTTDFIETVWINAPDTLLVTANSIAQKSFGGFSYSGISPSIKANDSVNDKTIIKIYYSKNPNPVTPPVDPTPEPTPEVFVPVVPNPNPRNPQPEVVPDDNTPEVAPTAKPTATPETITDETTPEVAGRSWALINLIASLIGMLLTIVLLFAKHEKEEENEENQEVKDEFERKRIYKVIGVIVAVISIVVFLLTENITLPMKLVDKYTVLMIVFALGNILCFYLGRRWHEVEDEEVEEQIQA